MRLLINDYKNNNLSFSEISCTPDKASLMMLNSSPGLKFYGLTTQKYHVGQASGNVTVIVYC